MPLLGLREDGFSRRQCTAHSKRSGRRCRNYAVDGRTTCRMHGGTSKRGKQHWNYRTGRYSNELQDAIDAIHRACQQPIKTVIAIFPDSIAAGGKVFPRGQPRHVVRVSFPDELFDVSVREQMRALCEAKKQINAELRMLRAAKKHVLARLHELGVIIERECERYQQSQAEEAGTAKPNGLSPNETSRRSVK